MESDSDNVSGTSMLRHSRMPAGRIVGNYADGMSAEEIAEVFELPAKGVRDLLPDAALRHPLQTY